MYVELGRGLIMAVFKVVLTDVCRLLEVLGVLMVVELILSLLHRR